MKKIALKITIFFEKLTDIYIDKFNMNSDNLYFTQYI